MKTLPKTWVIHESPLQVQVFHKLMTEAQMLKAFKIDNKEDLQKSFDLREEVFIVEQKVAREEEFDEFEDESRHYLVKDGNTACGVSRWRVTSEGVKLERFAVSKAYRRRGVASLLMKAMLDDIYADHEVNSKLMYLYAQVNAMPLYAKFGFLAEGPTFMECDILHQKMVLEPIATA